MRLLAACVLALAAAAAGCGGGTPELTPAEAAGREGEAVVRGLLLVDRNGEARLCEALAESFPPQCGGGSIRVVGASTEGLEEGAGVRWSNEPLEVRGRLRDGVLTVGG